jgi:hypothetical protein
VIGAESNGKYFSVVGWIAGHGSALVMVGAHPFMMDPECGSAGERRAAD